MTTVIPEGALTVEHDGEDLFVLIDGVRIARRGHPDTEEAILDRAPSGREGGRHQ